MISTTFASRCHTCGAWMVTADGRVQPHTCTALDVERNHARREGWREGYLFALANISDPMVQADKAEPGSGWLGAIEQGRIEIECEGPQDEA